jgi:hypothetical protein
MTGIFTDTMRRWYGHEFLGEKITSVIVRRIY